MLTPDKNPAASPSSAQATAFATAPIPLHAAKAGPLAAAVAAAQSATVATTPVSGPKKRPLLSRETRLGLVVACFFIALAAGVMGVKHYWISSGPEKTAPEVAAAQQVQVPTIPPEQPQAVHLSSTNIVEAPAVVPDIHISAPDPVLPVRAEVPTIDIDQPSVAPMPRTMIEATPILLPDIEVPLTPAPSKKKDDFSSKPVKEVKLEPLDLPPPMSADPVRPEIKNAVIRIGASEAKKDDPPKIDDPPIIADPPIADVPLKKGTAPPLEPIRIEPTPIETPKKEVDPPILENLPVIAEPMNKKDAPPKLGDPPAIEAPMKDPARIERPFQKNPPVMEPTKIDLTVDPPMKQKDASPARGEPRKDGDFDEDLHSAKPNETYKAISKQYYNSEAYAIALQRYNRDNPGQADYVRIPPIWVLEKKYQTDISANPTRTVNFTAPPIAESNTRTEPIYTVADNGEMLADIAKKQLGSEDAWKRLWDLNQQVNPAKTIPGGTRLRLPGQ